MKMRLAQAGATGKATGAAADGKKAVNEVSEKTGAVASEKTAAIASEKAAKEAAIASGKAAKEAAAQAAREEASRRTAAIASEKAAKEAAIASGKAAKEAAAQATAKTDSPAPLTSKTAASKEPATTPVTAKVTTGASSQQGAGPAKIASVAGKAGDAGATGTTTGKTTGAPAAGTTPATASKPPPPFTAASTPPAPGQPTNKGQVPNAQEQAQINDLYNRYYGAPESPGPGYWEKFDKDYDALAAKLLGKYGNPTGWSGGKPYWTPAAASTTPVATGAAGTQPSAGSAGVAGVQPGTGSGGSTGTQPSAGSKGVGGVPAGTVATGGPGYPTTSYKPGDAGRPPSVPWWGAIAPPGADMPGGRLAPPKDQPPLPGWPGPPSNDMAGGDPLAVAQSGTSTKGDKTPLPSAGEEADATPGDAPKGMTPEEYANLVANQAVAPSGTSPKGDKTPLPSAGEEADATPGDAPKGMTPEQAADFYANQAVAQQEAESKAGNAPKGMTPEEYANLVANQAVAQQESEEANSWSGWIKNWGSEFGSGVADNVTSLPGEIAGLATDPEFWSDFGSGAANDVAGLPGEIAGAVNSAYEGVTNPENWKAAGEATEVAAEAYFGTLTNIFTDPVGSTQKVGEWYGETAADVYKNPGKYAEGAAAIAEAVLFDNLLGVIDSNKSLGERLLSLGMVELDVAGLGVGGRVVKGAEVAAEGAKGAKALEAGEAISKGAKTLEGGEVVAEGARAGDAVADGSRAVKASDKVADSSKAVKGGAAVADDPNIVRASEALGDDAAKGTKAVGGGPGGVPPKGETYGEGLRNRAQAGTAAEKPPSLLEAVNDKDQKMYTPADKPPNLKGIRDDALAHAQTVADEMDVSVMYRPTTKRQAELIESRLAEPKPEFLKNKTVNDLDHYLGMPPETNGLVAHFQPKLPPSAEALAEQTGLKGKELQNLQEDLRDRFIQRRDEFNMNQGKLDGLQSEGVVKVEKGIVKNAQTGKPYTGDLDIFDIRGRNGEILDADTKARAYNRLEAGPVAAQHPDQMGWKYPKTDIQAKDIDNKIMASHAPPTTDAKGRTTGGEPLTVFQPGRKITSSYYTGGPR